VSIQTGAVNDRVTYKIPICATHHEAARALLMNPMLITIADDVAEGMAAAPSASSPSAILLHGIGLAEIVP
jgi:hypothetical protein